MENDLRNLVHENGFGGVLSALVDLLDQKADLLRNEQASRKRGNQFSVLAGRLDAVSAVAAKFKA